MIKKKKTIFGFIFVTLLMLTLPIISTLNVTSTEKTGNKYNNLFEKLNVFRDYIRSSINNDKPRTQPNVHEIGPEDYMNPAADINKSYSYNYGYWVGIHLANNYTTLNCGFRNSLGLDDYESVNDALEKLSLFRNLTSPAPNSYEIEYINFFTEQFEGLRDALKKYEGNKRSTFNNLIFKNQCTSTASTGNATKGNYTYMSQNFDVHKISTMFFHRLKEFIKGEPGSSIGGSKFTYNVYIINIPFHNNTPLNKYVILGIPILYEIAIVNGKGIGFSANNLVNESHFENQTIGAWIHYLNIWTMLNCNNITDVGLYRSNIRKYYSNIDDERAGSWPHTFDGSATTWGDAFGGILSIEYAGEYVHDPLNDTFQHEYFKIITDAPVGFNGKFKDIEDDILWHTNHFQWIDENEKNSFQKPDQSIKRSDRAMFLLNESHGNIDFDVIFNLVRDRYYQDPSRNICWGSNWYHERAGSYTSWIVETEYGHLPIVRWSPGRMRGEGPAHYDLSYWHEFDCNEYFS